MKKTLIVSIIIVMTIWLLSGVIILEMVPNLKDRATIGDMLGIVNSLFSGLALAFLIYTLLLQSKQLEIQNNEIQNGLKETKESNYLSVLSALIIHYSNEEEKYRNVNQPKLEDSQKKKDYYLNILHKLENKFNGEIN